MFPPRPCGLRGVAQRWALLGAAPVGACVFTFFGYRYWVRFRQYGAELAAVVQRRRESSCFILAPGPSLGCGSLVRSRIAVRSTRVSSHSSFLLLREPRGTATVRTIFLLSSDTPDRPVHAKHTAEGRSTGA